MAAIIKRRDGAMTGAVRAFGPTVAPPLATKRVDPVAEERAAMIDEIARLRHAMEQSRRDADHAVERARRSGYDAGVAAADDLASDRLGALQDSLAEQVRAFDARLDQLEGLAVVLAKAGLARVFDPPVAMSAMVAGTLAQYFAALRAETALNVRVSAVDFADAEALDAIAQAQGGVPMTIVADPALPTGACRIVCGLDRIDLDIPAQWQALAALLDSMAAGR